MRLDHVAIPRRVRGPTEKMNAAADLLLTHVPSLILGSYPVHRWGLAEGLSFAAGRWRAVIASGEVHEATMRASIVPVAQLASAMTEALLRGVQIDQREAAFAQLSEDSDNCLTGRPHAVILASGIL